MSAANPFAAIDAALDAMLPAESPVVKANGVHGPARVAPVADTPGRLEPVVATCDFIQWCRDHSADVSEPLWFAMLTNLVRLEGGREAAHAFSKGYPGYTARETDDKLDHAAKGPGPHTCSTIRELGFTGCPDDGHGVKAPCGLGWKAPAGEVEFEPATEEPEEVTPYRFTMAVARDHFLADYLAYASSRTDAAHEFHEAAGLVLLAAATPNVRAALAPYPGGLPTNINVLFVADSTISRKTTVKDIARDLHDAVIPTGALADLTSPEAFIEQLARRSGDSSTWFVDEVGDLLDKLHHAKFMAGMRGLLLTVYSGADYRYSRHSKKTKAGTTVEDEDVIQRPHLSILGATTPSVFDVLTSADVRSGLLPRFAVVMPSRKPPRAPFYGSPGWDEARRGPLATVLHRLYTWAVSTPRSVTFAPGTLDTLDGFASNLEREAGMLDEAKRPMLHRLAPMALKVAMLVAAGRPETPTQDRLVVTADDADAAVTIATRWRADAITFAGRIGETEFERLVERCLRAFRQKGRKVPRRIVAQNVHLSKRMLDDVEATLADRGDIAIERIEAPGRPTLVIWRTPSA